MLFHSLLSGQKRSFLTKPKNGPNMKPVAINRILANINASAERIPNFTATDPVAQRILNNKPGRIFFTMGT